MKGNNVKSKRTYNVLELFAGAGGLALGLEEAGFNNVGLVEIDKNAVAVNFAKEIGLSIIDSLNQIEEKDK